MSRTAVEGGASTLPGRSATKSSLSTEAKPRSAPFDQEPGYYQPAGLWLFGNVRLLDAKLAMIEQAFGPPDQAQDELDEIERLAERTVLGGNVLVTGVHSPAHMRAAVVPLRWGSPRILVVSGGFKHHLGENLNQEPFRAARLWRYQWDPRTDLIVSRRAPDKLPTFAQHNPTVDRLVAKLVSRELTGCLFGNPEF
jgi:DNA processing protein